MKQNNMLAMILAGGRGSRLHELTNKVAKPAVSYGGKYRIVDFPLSNCANSGVDIVGVLTQYESVLLNSYVAAGGRWGLDARESGVFVLPPREKADADLVSGTLQEFSRKPGDMDRLRVLPRTSEEILQYAKKRNPFNHPCMMFRREAVLHAGNYQDFPGFEDYYLWVRMLRKGCKGYNVQEVILDMRTGNGMYDRRGGREYLHWYCVSRDIFTVRNLLPVRNILRTVWSVQQSE